MCNYSDTSPSSNTRVSYGTYVYRYGYRYIDIDIWICIHVHALMWCVLYMYVFFCPETYIYTHTTYLHLIITGLLAVPCVCDLLCIRIYTLHLYPYLSLSVCDAVKLVEDPESFLKTIASSMHTRFHAPGKESLSSEDPNFEGSTTYLILHVWRYTPHNMCMYKSIYKLL